MREVIIASSVRTPVGRAFKGTLRATRPDELAAVAIKGALERVPQVDPKEIEDVILGCAMPEAEQGMNVARVASLRAGLPVEVSALTINRFCSSGLQAIALAAERIMAGGAEVIVAGGTESMSRLPYYLDGARWGYRLGHQELVDGMYRDGFFCPVAKMVMGETAETLATQYHISREEQDQFALGSQQRAAAAQSSGRFDAEIAPVTIEGKKGATVFARDEHLFLEATIEKMAKLPPVFSKTGTITAANSSGITDGAAAVVLVSEKFAQQHNLKPLARIMATTSAGVDPRIMGIGPVPAIRKLEQKHGLKLADFDLVELNEAFAAQVLACDRELHFDREKLNVNGGAIALGHPIGCTGARITVTLLHEMLKRKARRGLATLCVSGGMGMTLAIEKT